MQGDAPSDKHDLNDLADIGWKQMSRILETELPQNNNKRRFFWIWLMGALLLSFLALGYSFYRNERVQPPIPVQQNLPATPITEPDVVAQKIQPPAPQPLLDISTAKADPVFLKETITGDSFSPSSQNLVVPEKQWAPFDPISSLPVLTFALKHELLPHPVASISSVKPSPSSSFYLHAQVTTNRDGVGWHTGVAYKHGFNGSRWSVGTGLAFQQLPYQVEAYWVENTTIGKTNTPQLDSYWVLNDPNANRSTSQRYTFQHNLSYLTANANLGYHFGKRLELQSGVFAGYLLQAGASNNSTKESLMPSNTTGNFAGSNTGLSYSFKRWRLGNEVNAVFHVSPRLNAIAGYRLLWRPLITSASGSPHSPGWASLGIGWRIK